MHDNAFFSHVFYRLQSRVEIKTAVQDSAFFSCVFLLKYSSRDRNLWGHGKKVLTTAVLWSALVKMCAEKLLCVEQTPPAVHAAAAAVAATVQQQPQQRTSVNAVASAVVKYKKGLYDTSTAKKYKK